MAHFNLNDVNIDQLVSNVKMIGRDRAERLLKYRDEHGGFKDWNDVDNVPGFSKKMIDDLQHAGATIDGGGAKEARGRKH